MSPGRMAAQIGGVSGSSGISCCLGDREMNCQSVIENFLPDPAQFFSNPIMIATENIFRTNQTLLKIFQADFDEKIFSRPCS